MPLPIPIVTWIVCAPFSFCGSFFSFFRTNKQIQNKSQLHFDCFRLWIIPFWMLWLALSIFIFLQKSGFSTKQNIVRFNKLWLRYADSNIFDRCGLMLYDSKSNWSDPAGSKVKTNEFINLYRLEIQSKSEHWAQIIIMHDLYLIKS